MTPARSPVGHHCWHVVSQRRQQGRIWRPRRHNGGCFYRENICTTRLESNHRAAYYPPPQSRRNRSRHVARKTSHAACGNRSLLPSTTCRHVTADSVTLNPNRRAATSISRSSAQPVSESMGRSRVQRLASKGLCAALWVVHGQSEEAPRPHRRDPAHNAPRPRPRLRLQCKLRLPPAHGEVVVGQRVQQLASLDRPHHVVRVDEGHPRRLSPPATRRAPPHPCPTPHPRRSSGSQGTQPRPHRQRAACRRCSRSARQGAPISRRTRGGIRRHSRGAWGRFGLPRCGQG